MDTGFTPGTDGASSSDGPAQAANEAELEVERLRRRVAELESAPVRHPIRVGFAVVLGVLTVIAVVAASAAMWTTRTMLQTDRFMAIVEPVLQSPQVADALSVRVTDEVLTALSLEERLETRLAQLQGVGGEALADALGATPAQRARLEALPLPELTDLAEPIASGLEARIATRIDQLITSPEFANLLVSGAELAHTKSVALLRGDYEELPNVEVAEGEVRLNLIPPIAAILEDLVDQGLAAFGIEQIPFIDPFADPEVSLQRLESALGTDLPDDLGQLTVMSTSQLEELQAATRAADRLALLLVVVAIGLLAATIAVAPRRRRALLVVSLGCAAAVVLTMGILRGVSPQIADVAATPQGGAALLVIADVVLDSLRSTMVFVLIVALLVAVVAYLSGRPRWFQRAIAAAKTKPGGSDLERFVTRHYDVLRIAVLAVSVGVLFLTGISLWSLLIVAALAGLAMWGLAHAHKPHGAPPPVPAEEDAVEVGEPRIPG